MTRLELLRILIGQAHANGFEFRRWYMSRLGLPWISAEASLELLQSQRRYYSLLFSHEFAVAFFAPDSTLTLQMPARSFERRMPDGTLRVIHRKPYMRRRIRPQSWRFHLRAMALADEPLRYMRRYLNVTDELDEADEPPQPRVPRATPAATTAKPAERQLPRALTLARTAAERREQAAKAAAAARKTAKKKGTRASGANS